MITGVLTFSSLFLTFCLNSFLLDTWVMLDSVVDDEWLLHYLVQAVRTSDVLAVKLRSVQCILPTLYPRVSSATSNLVYWTTGSGGNDSSTVDGLDFSCPFNIK